MVNLGVDPLDASEVRSPLELAEGWYRVDYESTHPQRPVLWSQHRKVGAVLRSVGMTHHWGQGYYVGHVAGHSVAVLE